jgi:hydrogenase 3 maturation protease
MGIGNADRGDDGVGPYVARRLRHPDWQALDCGTAPENFTAVVQRARPEFLVMVDSADMKIAPGEIRRLDRNRIRASGIGTHLMPLYLLMDYLAESAGEIIFIGVQPKQTEWGMKLGREAKDAALRIMKLIKDHRLSEVTAL